MGNRRGEMHLGTLAYDISDLLDKYEYPIPDGIGPDEIEAALPAFLAALGLDKEGKRFFPGGLPVVTFMTFRLDEANAPTDPAVVQILHEGSAAPAAPLALVADQGPITRHTCNRRHPGQALPYGRLAAKGKCPRCDELHDGAAPRPRPEWVDAYRRMRDIDAQRAEEIKEHFADGGPHRRGDCAPVCTALDY